MAAPSFAYTEALRDLGAAQPSYLFAGRTTDENTLLYIDWNGDGVIFIYRAANAGFLLSDPQMGLASSDFTFTRALRVVRWYDTYWTRGFSQGERVYIVGRNGKARYYEARINVPASYHFKPREDADVLYNDGAHRHAHRVWREVPIGNIDEETKRAVFMRHVKEYQASVPMRW